LHVPVTRRQAARAAAAAAIIALAACAPAIRATLPGPPAPQQMAEFWVEPADLAARDLYWGPGGREHAPDPAWRWQFVARKSPSFKKYSPGFDVRDPHGVLWNVKSGDEAQSEVVSSRLMWALGYHQPPTYYVRSWSIDGKVWGGPKEPARFRPEPPSMKKVADWSWHQDPFVGTQPWRGALVMMTLINNCDLKPTQNTLYELDHPSEGARRWYVVRDLGLSLGETGFWYPERNDVHEFETEKFILGLRPDGTVRFNYSGRWKELFRNLRPEDVRWTCERLSRLSDRQWEDAFRAAEYRPEIAQRFIRRFKEKIAEGLSLAREGGSGAAAPRSAPR
jgi:hypothetical protein